MTTFKPGPLGSYVIVDQPEHCSPGSSWHKCLDCCSFVTRCIQRHSASVVQMTSSVEDHNQGIAPINGPPPPDNAPLDTSRIYINGGSNYTTKAYGSIQPITMQPYFDPYNSEKPAHNLVDENGYESLLDNHQQQHRYYWSDNTAGSIYNVNQNNNTNNLNNDNHNNDNHNNGSMSTSSSASLLRRPRLVRFRSQVDTFLLSRYSLCTPSSADPLPQVAIYRLRET